jgi:hypothetical protein
VDQGLWESFSSFLLHNSLANIWIGWRIARILFLIRISSLANSSSLTGEERLEKTSSQKKRVPPFFLQKKKNLYKT